MILGVESSCDESALALFEPECGRMISLIHSQLALHETYGGVVPDLASREHLRHFPRLIGELRQQADWTKISRIAVTAGPGLAGCLAIGLSIAKALALAMRVPLFTINHLRGHAFSPFIALQRGDPAHFSRYWKTLLPHLGLIVSGGNTLLIRIDEEGRLSVLAETVDDAAGEAIDKGARLLGLGYPGGPALEKAAAGGNRQYLNFPRNDHPENRHAFSFSGLKTSLRYKLEATPDAILEDHFADFCASYEEAVVDQLLTKTERFLHGQNFASIGLSGGVANNRRLRTGFQALDKPATRPALIAEPAYTGDNAAMIAFAAYLDPHGSCADPSLRASFKPSQPITG